MLVPITDVLQYDVKLIKLGCGSHVARHLEAPLRT